MLRSNKIIIKSPEDISKMVEGGKILSRVKKELFDKVQIGISAWEIEELANELIKQYGAEASFKRVPNYSWATCVNVNDGIVHGIPKKEIVFKKGDVVSVDVGVFYKGFHTDTSISKGLELDAEGIRFLETGKIALHKAIKACVSGGRIYDISKAIQDTIKAAGYTPVRALVGHGVGRDLHEDPQIPCFVVGKREDSLEIPVGAVLAIEVMYMMGSPEIVLEKDGWTISTADGKISALFEDSVAISEKGTQVITGA